MITKSQWNELKKGDVLVMSSGLQRPVLSVGKNCVRLRKVSQNGYNNDTTVYCFSDLNKKIEKVLRTITIGELYHAIENMEKYGGSFIKALANCFRRADSANVMKLAQAFPEYVTDYLNIYTKP